MLNPVRAKFPARTFLRLLYIAISLFGIGYELMKVEPVRWPLVAGYVGIIAVTALLLRQRRNEA
ncbi:MAG: hypothetical protein ONB48_07295 [candidate division KSB1 bacterium]|nr:hypothetical protein [candidate division KSB1 bacterium]MDZ7274625.1 hypothetical protein [candidate division KSB1 bacterium]MDZ7285450.1 hypothetical protein [candidate division KSB1 bacterium]MDZ7298482.1 hypothetical protein [candidate division KSB1 bacterium]MDZ7306966.1 hypothetical protein [candidate division KSB1 bacterium]